MNRPSGPTVGSVWRRRTEPARFVRVVAFRQELNPAVTMRDVRAGDGSHHVQLLPDFEHEFALVEDDELDPDPALTLLANMIPLTLLDGRDARTVFDVAREIARSPWMAAQVHAAAKLALQQAASAAHLAHDQGWDSATRLSVSTWLGDRSASESAISNFPDCPGDDMDVDHDPSRPTGRHR